MEGKLQVNEALLTGEADEITKEIGDPLMSGSFVVSGKAYARLDKVGADSCLGFDCQLGNIRIRSDFV